ncbi:MAG: 2-oxoacid:acceptor oxidoreductase family protein [Candidatus Rokubacteria bacterium]|nr:2-oxoacid:acceptor oxidoreductase family protein [Candidatus Rokubacteria bacterium]
MSTSFLREGPMPYCKGCGHALVARQLAQALGSLGLEPHDVVVTSDIGCVGLVDPIFPAVHTVHTIHGRSTAVATGAVLADTLLGDGRLKNIVMIGDGGASIGLLHLTQAALLNVDVTVLLHNNMLYGMTGGQHSALTPERFATTTTPGGNWVPAIDMEQLLRGCHAGFFARLVATDGALAGVIADAIRYPGFALVEVLELCTGYGVPLNHLDGKALRAIAAEQGWSLGVRFRRDDRPPYHAAYRKRFPVGAPTPPGDGDGTSRGPDTGAASPARRHGGDRHGNGGARAWHRVTRPVGVVIAGSAGERVQTAAAVLAQAALAAGLHGVQKNDYPVTVGSGFSLSEVTISPHPILYTGIEHPEAVIVTSTDGVREIKGRGDLGRLASNGLVIADETIAADLASQRTIAVPLRATLTPRFAALGAVAGWLDGSGILDHEAMTDAIAALAGDEAPAFEHAAATGRSLVASAMAWSA